MEEKIVYMPWIAAKLREEGFKIIDVRVNQSQPQYDCYVFEDTPAFREAFTRISKGQEALYRMSVANQNIVRMGERTPRDKEHPFGRINIEAMQIAMQRLGSVGAFKLWCYLDKNEDGFSLELSQKACADWGIKKDSYYKARDALIEAGYLEEVGENSNVLVFHEIPIEKKKTSEVVASNSEIQKN